MTKRKSFSQEFKREAVRLLETSQKSSADLARELGVRRNQLYKWKEQLSQRGVGAFPGSGRGSGGNDELARLRKEFEKVKEERGILKRQPRTLPRSSSEVRVRAS